jgi:hypothetical protein
MHQGPNLTPHAVVPISSDQRAAADDRLKMVKSISFRGSEATYMALPLANSFETDFTSDLLPFYCVVFVSEKRFFENPLHAKSRPSARLNPTTRKNCYQQQFPP